jgi:hypothetical protein
MLQAEVVLRDLMEGKLEFQSSQYEEKLGILRRTVKAGSKLLQVQLSAKGLVEIKLRDAVNRVLDLVEEAGHLACRVAQKDEGMAAEVSRLNAKMEQHYIKSEEKLKQSGSQIIKMEVERERLNNFVGLKCQQYESKKEEAARLGDLLNISSKAAAEYRKEVKWLKEEYERRAAVLDEECPVVMKQLLKETQQAQRQEYMSDLEKAQEHPELLLRFSVELDSVQEGGVGPVSLGLSDNLSVVFPKMNLEGMVSLRYWAWHQATQAEYKAIMGESSEEPESDVEVEVNGAAVADTRVLHSEEKEAQMMESSKPRDSTDECECPLKVADKGGRRLSICTGGEDVDERVGCTELLKASADEVEKSIGLSKTDRESLLWRRRQRRRGRRSREPLRV